ASNRDRVLAEHFGGKAQPIGSRLLTEWNSLAEAVKRALQQAEIFLVTTPEKFALNESLRSRNILEEGSSPLMISAVVLNRAVTNRGQRRRGQNNDLCGPGVQHSAKVKAGGRNLLRRSGPVIGRRF